MSDKPICNLPELVGGPFKQVMYLGCSVKDFKITVGWGGEVGSCVVNLVRDPFPFWEENDRYRQNDQFQTDNSITFTEEHLEHPHYDRNQELNSDIKSSPNVEKEQSYRGKRCYNVDNPYSSADYMDLTAADPGFLADISQRTSPDGTVSRQGHIWGGENADPDLKYDIIGVPTIFKWEDVFFGGIIQNWNKKDDGSYSVEISSFAKILKGVTLILKEYYGSISTNVNNEFFGPFNWAFFPSEDYVTPWPDREHETLGGAANIFNIYGYLESQGFGYSRYNKDKGIPAIKVYEAVREIFSPPAALSSDELRKRTSPFSPSPGVGTRQLFDKRDYVKVDAEDITYENIPLTNFGLINGAGAFIDLSDVPSPPDGVYINTDTMDLISFIDFCCEGAGMDYIVNYDGVIKITTIDRKEFKYRDDLSYYIEQLSSDDKVISYNLGEEYSHNQSTKIVIGGNQKRLLQINSYTIGTPTYRVYDPNTNLFYGGAGSQESFRQPNFLNWAGGSSGSYGEEKVDKFIAAGGYSWSPHNFNDVLSGNLNQLSVVKGSYYDPPDTGSSSSLAINGITPFFGIGKNGIFRSTFYDNKSRQMLLRINWTDIEPFLPGLYDNNYASSTLQSWVRTNIQGQFGFIDYSPLEYGTGDFIITEYELRAAGAGFDQWWNYTQARAAFGAPSDLARIIYNYLTKNYSVAFAVSIIYTDLAYDKSRFDYMAYMQVASATYAGRPLNLRPVTFEQYSAWASGFSSTLRSIHGFIADLVNTHYGKTYAVRVPNVLTGYVDGGSKENYEISDAAWESRGNMIDDTMFIGSAALSKLQEEDGRIGCLLGFDNTPQFVAYGGPAVDMPTQTWAPGRHSMAYMMGLRMGFVGGTTYWPLIHNFANDASVMIPHGTYGYYDASLPSKLADSQRFKLYTKASPLTLNPQNKNNPNIVYDGLIPKVILTPPGEISSIADTSINGIYDEIWSLHQNGINRPASTETIADRNFDILPAAITLPENLQIFLKFMMWQKSRAGILDDLVNDNPALIHKAPLPTFAAIPIESKYYRYGPWINNPSALEDKVVTIPNISEDQRNNIFGNLGGSTSAVIEDTLVPWEFGGEGAMSVAGATMASLGNQYQTNIEVGSITFAGLILRGTNAGQKLANDRASTIVSSISISMDANNGITSTYQFRTSSKKLGLFNKELSDTYKNFNQQSYRNNLKIARANSRSVNAAGLISTTPNSTLFGRFRSAQLQAFGVNPAFQCFNRSPLTTNNMPANFVMVANNFVAQSRNNFQGSFRSPGNVDSINDSGGTSTSYFSIMPDNEAYKVCGNNYDKVSMMSFDGLFSPISLYPTVNNSTFYISKYTTQQCPYCRGGTQQYIHHYVDLTTLSNKEPSDIKREDTDNVSFKLTKTYAKGSCPFCIDETQKENEIKQRNTVNLVDPPYILVSGSDDYVDNRRIEYRENPLVINKYTLNPMVLNSGDFGIGLGRQRGDTSTHNIDIAGFGHLPPAQGLSARGSLSSNPTFNTQAIDMALKNANEDSKDLQNNIRFIGLRGPLMVHGWGYDVAGYPVPNSSGEIKTVNGIPVSYNGKTLYKNQVVNADGTVTDPYPENTFAKGWADQPGSWPVGPVDLRWDHNSCTWVSPQGYKRVWVTLEQDLINEKPVRGSIESLGDPADIQPAGLRKVVYVSNPLGTTRAPRFSALYCEYMPENNQYFPLSVGAVFATGTLISADSVTIHADYAYLEEGQDPITYNASFENPLNLDTQVDSKAILIFGGEGWILQSVGG